MLCCFCFQWKSLYLLVRLFTTWGGHQCIPLALRANCQYFVSSNACQHVIELEWQAGIDATFLSIILAYLCPPLIFSNLIKFTKSRSILPDASDPDAFKHLKANIAQPGSDDTLSLEKISNSKKLSVFYNAPRTKFVIHTVTFAATNILIVKYAEISATMCSLDVVCNLPGILLLYSTFWNESSIYNNIGNSTNDMSWILFNGNFSKCKSMFSI